MTGLLKRLLGPKRQPINEVLHPTLGTLSYDAEAEHWVATAVVGGHQFRVSVGGEFEPDPALLTRAAVLQTELAALFGNLVAFLDRAATDMPHLAGEIHALKVADVAVWWPKQPDAVMIWFSGPSSERIWHCDYSNGSLSGLAFDG